MASNDYLTEKQVQAEYPPFRVKTLQIWRMCKRGPRFLKIGSRVFYPRNEIEAYIAAHMVNTEPSPRHTNTSNPATA